MKKVFFSICFLVPLLFCGCVQQDACNDFVVSAEKQLEDTEFKGRFHYAIDDYEKAARCYERAEMMDEARENWVKVVETYMLENERELGEGSLTSAGKCNFFAAYYSLTKLDDQETAVTYAQQSVEYYEQANETGFNYHCARAIANNDPRMLEEANTMVDFTGDDAMRRIRDDIQEKIQ